MNVNSLSVLLTTYHEAFLHRGGGEFEIIGLSENLQSIGLIADIYGPYSRSIDSYDVVIHFSIHSGGLPLLRKLSSHRKRIIIFPNYWCSSLDGDGAPSNDVEEIVRLSDLFLFKSKAELKNFRERYVIPEAKVKLIRAPIDCFSVEDAPKGIFSTLYGIDNYTLWVGGIEPIKNQLNVIRALAHVDTPVVFLGNGIDEEYYSRCRNEAPKHFHFIDSVPYRSEIYRSALRDCDLYMELSLDPPGASAIEAAIAGCRLLLPDIDWCWEFFGENSSYANSSDIDDIRSGFLKALKTDAPESTLQVSLKEQHATPESLMPIYNIMEDLRNTKIDY
jgi:glycosyltransferase involved in cell wall biosynthesis